MSRDLEHILFVINSLGSGGAERVVSVLANEFSRRGLRVSIVLRYNTGREIKQTLEPGIALFDLTDAQSALYREAPHLGKHPWPVRLLMRTLTKRHRSAVATKVLQGRLGAVVRYLQPDIAVAFMVRSNIDTTNALARSSIPVVISERTDPARTPHGPLRRWQRDRAYGKADGLVFQTREALEHFSLAIQARSAVIPNPLEIPPHVKRIPRRGEVLRVVSVGRLVQSKRFDMLIRAIGSLRAKGLSLGLELYGEGPDLDALESLSASLGLEAHVRFMGYRKDVLASIADANLFVLCSEYEGMPNALLEALGLGIPAVSTDCPIGGPRAVVQDGVNGLLVPVGDQAALEAAMERLLRDPELAARFGQASVSVLETLGVSRIADLWMAEFSSAKKRKAARAKP